MKLAKGEMIAAIVAAGIAAVVAAVAGFVVGMLIYGVVLRDMGMDKDFESLPLVAGVSAVVFAIVAFIVTYLKMSTYADPQMNLDNPLDGLTSDREPTIGRKQTKN